MREIKFCASKRRLDKYSAFHPLVRNLLGGSKKMNPGITSGFGFGSPMKRTGLPLTSKVAFDLWADVMLKICFLLLILTTT